MPSRLVRFGLVLALLAFVTACREKPPERAERTTDIPSIPVAKVGLEDVPRQYSAIGTVKADERIQISSRITGYIQKIWVHEGDAVRKGSILVEIDSSDTEAAIRRAEATVRSAATSLADAERDVERFAGLKDRQVVSEESYRKATVKRDVARSALGEARAALDSALAQRRYATIESPVTGVTISRLKQQGDLASPGVAILTIDSGKRLLFETFIAESRIADIAVGGKVDVIIDALGHQTLDGTVLRIVPSGDPVSRRYQVDIALPDGSKAYPGMFGRAHFAVGTERMPVVPRDALVERGGLVGVFVIDEGGHARFRWLRTGREWATPGQGARVAIRAGLTGGETILAQDDRRVRDGDAIAVTERAGSNE